MNPVYVVHCVDAEGPLFESLEATFERVEKLFGIRLTPDRATLLALQRQELDLGGREAAVADCVSPKRLAFLSTWDQIDTAMQEVLDPSFRGRIKDSFGRPYVLNWFCLDSVGFEDNPRRKALGYHVVYRYYRDQVARSGCERDGLCWHYHGVPFSHAAHFFGTNWSYTNHHLQILTRRVIDLGSWPAVYRPGGNIERPDINLWLEQWIPFDYGNQAMEPEDEHQQPDFQEGRLSDWRRATREWEVYHPSLYDYQVKGTLNRWIARCLNLDSRLGSLSQREVDKAFDRARAGLPTLLGVTNHDDRDMRGEIAKCYDLLKTAEQRTGVPFRLCNAVEGMRLVLNLPPKAPVRFSLSWKGSVLTVEADTDVWGAQPFLAIRTHEARYLHDNWAYHGGRRWSYTFDEMSVPLEAVSQIGIAANDAYGNTTVVQHDPRSGATAHRYLNGS